jgi:hypothetical protein
MWRLLFQIVTAASLVACLLFGGLWARSLRHFELVHLKYARWVGPEELVSYSAGFAWYSNTLRLEVIRLPFLPANFRGQSDEWFQVVQRDHPPGPRLDFIGDATSRLMNGYPPGFTAGHYPSGIPGYKSDRWVLAVRPWLPTLLAAVLPANWLVRRRMKRRAPFWQFGLRELFVAITVVAVILGAAIWLKN